MNLDSRSENTSSFLRGEGGLAVVLDKPSDFRDDEKSNSIAMPLSLHNLLTSNTKWSSSNSKRMHRSMRFLEENSLHKNVIGTRQDNRTLQTMLKEINGMHLADDSLVALSNKDAEKKAKKVVSFDPKINRWHNGSVGVVDSAPSPPSRSQVFNIIS